MRKFLSRILVYILVLSSITLAVNAFYIRRVHTSNFGTMSDKKNDDAFIVNVPSNITICNFGSSHGYYGFNYEDAPGKFTCFNFALASQSLEYDFRILENYRDRIADGAVVFIVLSHFSLFGKPDAEGANFASKNKRYYRFLERPFIMEYDSRTNFYVKYMPSLAADNAVRFLQILLGGRKDMWNAVTDREAAKVHAPRRYKGFVANKKDKSGRRIFNSKAVDALLNMIALCRELGARPVLITTPYLKEYNDAVRNNDPEFYADFYAAIEDVTWKTGTEYYDYSEDERYTGSYRLFFNSDHLNREGARLFTNTLLREVLSIDVNSPAP